MERLWPKEGVDNNDRILNPLLYHMAIKEDAPKKVIWHRPRGRHAGWSVQVPIAPVSAQLVFNHPRK